MGYNGDVSNCQSHIDYHGDTETWVNDSGYQGWRSYLYCCADGGVVDDGCEAGWTMVDGQCLKVFDDVKTWGSAEASCIENGGHLATIGSQAQNDWISEHITGMAWHGATDESSEGTWTDSVGQSGLPFSNWNDGEPNKWFTNCGSIYPVGVDGCAYCGKWKPNGCSGGMPYVCGLGNAVTGNTIFEEHNLT